MPINKKKKKKYIINNDYYENKLNDFQTSIINNSHLFSIPKNINFKSINTHSWFDLFEANSKNFFSKNISDIKFDKISHDGYFVDKFLKLYLNDSQKIVINKWIDSYTSMYNETIKYFRSRQFKNINDVENICQLKVSMAKSKSKVYDNSEINLNNKSIFINKHILDYAINDALQRLNSCLTMKRKGFIKHFRLRYIKFSKKDRIVKIEKYLFASDGFCKNVLGIVDCCLFDFNYEDYVDTTCVLKKYQQDYYLLIKRKMKEKDNNQKDTISFDPGMRTILTGYGSNKIVEIGRNVSKILEKKLKRIDRIDKSNIKKKKKRKIIKKHYKRIKDMMNDMHWKICRYLSRNYKNVIMGNFSTKQYGETENVRKMNKRKGNIISFYEMKEKMKYICKKNKMKYKETDERNTTQCCGKCGNQKKDVGKSEVYECNKCKYKEGRDIHSARNILIKSKIC